MLQLETRRHLIGKHGEHHQRVGTHVAARFLFVLGRIRGGGLCVQCPLQSEYLQATLYQLYTALLLPCDINTLNRIGAITFFVRFETELLRICVRHSIKLS